MSYITTASEEKLAIVVDIGSGSVGIGIVHLVPNTTPEIVWTHREYTTIKETSLQPATKIIKTALLNSFLELDAKGTQFIPNHLTSEDIIDTHVYIHAPWVYTVIKSVTYSQEHSFTITDELIDELTSAAEVNTKETLADLPELASLVVLNATPQAIIANGYRISNWHNLKARTLKLSLNTTLTHQALADMIYEMHEKTIPNTQITVRSHTAAVHDCLQTLHPEMQENCIVTITTEATEIGIVRNGVLQYVTSMPTGTYTLAREIASKANVPTEESYSSLKHSYNKIQKDKNINAAVESYKVQLTKLFLQTGDALHIPKSIYVHCEGSIHELFLRITSEAATASTEITHSVHYLTNDILGGSHEQDTSFLVAVQQAATRAN